MSHLKFFLTSVPFFEALSTEEIEQIEPLFIERSYNKGETIFWENEIGDEFFIVKNGIIKISRLDEAKEVILSTMHEGDYFGEMAILENGQVRSATAEAIEKSTLYSLKRENFTQLLERKPRLTLKLLNIAMDRLRKSNDLIKDLTTLDSRSRIFKMVYRLSEEYGVPSDSGLLIDLKLTHQLIADMTSTVRETVTKALAELQQDEIIQIEKKKIIILSIEKLRQKIGSSH